MRAKSLIIEIITFFCVISPVWAAEPIWIGRDVPQAFSGEVSGNLVDRLGPLAPPAVSSRVEFEMPQFENIGNGKLELALGKLRLQSGNAPALPFETKRYSVPFGQKAKVFLKNVELVETAGSMPIEMVPPPLEWSLTPRWKLSVPKERYFPGRFVNFSQVGRELRVNIFPVQWDRSTGKLLRVKSADVVVEYEPEILDAPGIWGNPSVIVTTEGMRPAAKLLQDFHKRKLHLYSDIITIEQIDRVVKPISQEDLPDGYKTEPGRDTAVIPHSEGGYNYLLARKISSYLQNRIRRGGFFRSVTLLGADIPPSYYYAPNNEWARTFTPTDRCYGALDKCTRPHVAVGRLPFSSIDEVKSYLAKVTQWLSHGRWAATELSIYGGQTFPTSDVYVGELGGLELLRSSDWRNAKKFFQSSGNYNRTSVLDLVSGKLDSTFAYYLDHGAGNRWYTDRSKGLYVTSQDILSTKAGPNALAPLIVSISCNNAAFDGKISRDKLFSVPGEGEISIGEALLKAEAGAVAYVGSARGALGQPLYRFDSRGNLVPQGTTYGLKLLDSMFEKYREAHQDSIGALFLSSAQDYVLMNGNLAAYEDAWTYFIAQLLGDPNLPMPERGQVDRSYFIPHSTFDLDDSVGFGLPVLHLKGQRQVSLTYHSRAFGMATLYRVLRDGRGAYIGEQKLESYSFIDGDHAMPLSIPESDFEGQYFLKLENTKGVPLERHVMFKLKKE